MVSDSSGKGNVGTISGASWAGSGRYGSALSFDGVNDWVTVADSASLDLTSGMTLEAWVYPANVADWETVVMKEQSGTPPSDLVYALYAGSNNSRPRGYVYIGSEVEVMGTASLPVNSWTHLAVTYGSSTVRLFVNGTQVATKSKSGSIQVSTGGLKIGGNSVWSEWFAGMIDEVRVYNRALAQVEIQADMNTPIETGQIAVQNTDKPSLTPTPTAAPKGTLSSKLTATPSPTPKKRPAGGAAASDFDSASGASALMETRALTPPGRVSEFAVASDYRVATEVWPDEDWSQIAVAFVACPLVGLALLSGFAPRRSRVRRGRGESQKEV